MRNVLIIAYGFPPYSGSGTYRPLRFIKYLRHYGWNAVVLTVNEKYYSKTDVNLLSEIPADVKVCRTRSLELHPKDLGIKSVNTKSLQGEKRTLLKSVVWTCARLVRKIKESFLIPDEQIGWFPFCLLKGLAICKRENINIIFATAWPNTDILIGMLLSKLTGKRFIVDLRDSWTQDITGRVKARWRLKLEKWLELGILRHADKVITVSEPISKNILLEYPELDESKFLTITNGFDREHFRFRNHLKIDKRQNHRLTITYTGTFAEYRSPRYFFEAIRQLIDEQPQVRNNFRVRIVGRLDPEGQTTNKDLISNLNIEDLIEVIGYVPHSECIQYILKSDVLLLIVGEGKWSEGVVTGKIFEYMGAGRYVLALVPDGTAKEIVKGTNIGICASPSNVTEIKFALKNLLERYSANELYPAINFDEVNKYEAKELTRKLACVFHKVDKGV